MKKNELTKLANEKLEKLLNEAEWCDRDLLREYDERRHDGRIELGEPMQPEDLEEYFRKRREEREKRQRKAS